MASQNIDREKLKELIEQAGKAREMAYAPYSEYKVGAALLSEQGHIYKGCNVENASLGLTLCAERAAVANAIINGEKQFTAIAIVTDDEPPATPCGACRQVLSEFSRELLIIAVNLKGHELQFRLAELIPHMFELK